MRVNVAADLPLRGIFLCVSFTEISAFSLTPSFHLLPWRIFQPVPGLILLIGGLRLLNTDLPLIISDHYVYLINLLDALLVSPPHHPGPHPPSFLFCHISGSMWKIGLIIHLMSQEKMKILSRLSVSLMADCVSPAWKTWTKQCPMKGWSVDTSCYCCRLWAGGSAWAGWRWTAYFPYCIPVNREHLLNHFII